jgi:hypothetical protein
LESLAALLWQADERKAFSKAPADASRLGSSSEKYCKI